MDVPEKDYHRKKPDAKEYTLHDFINRRGPEKKFINTERRSVTAWVWDQSGDCLPTGLRECWR